VIEEDLGVAVLDAEAPSASKVLADGAARLRWSAQEVPRWARMADGRRQRQSMTRTYLPRARAAGARVVENLRVERLHWAGDRVVGASAVAMDGDVPRSVDIRAERVFVCAGAVQTPALLRRSGMRGRIGETLYVHPTVKVAARFDRPLDGHDDVPVHQVKEFAPQLSFGGSASRPGFISLALSDNWLRDGRLADQWRNMAVYYAAIRPSGHGRVTSVPYVTDPLVTYRINRADISLLRSGLMRLTHLLLEAGASSVHPAVPGAPAATRPVDVPEVGRAFRRSTAVLMTVHLCSTVPMGEDPARCPADSWGKLRGTKNLYVNDASLLPNAPGVNPQGTIMVLAARNAAHYLAEVGG
ncbi:MAG: GMC family oxidoreductase N-terminal domain-containing protein, partial [Actinobacteria bacterium]|nr:GMC family oxidoreductase N-terminal domain-containing protein [Actinomycetota bacterium]